MSLYSEMGNKRVGRNVSYNRSQELDIHITSESREKEANDCSKQTLYTQNKRFIITNLSNLAILPAITTDLSKEAISPPLTADVLHTAQPHTRTH